MEHEILAQLLDWVRSHYFGKYRGTVTDRDDPAKMGRLKVKVPAVLGDTELWAMPCVPYAGKQAGFYFLPEKDTGVWVEFEAGDPSFPVWSGFYWGDSELPGDAAAAQKTLRTGSLTLHIDDDGKKMEVTAKDGGTLTVGDSIVAERQQSKHTVDTSGVTAEATGKKHALDAGGFKVNDGALEVT